jgi:hypothetical protein
MRYLKGLPGVVEYRARLVTLKGPEAIEAVLDDIERRYEGFEMERSEIELVNYHERCEL